MQTYLTNINLNCKFIRRTADKVIIGIQDEDGVQHFFNGGDFTLTESRNSRPSDTDADPLKSTAASAITYTLFANLIEATRIRQDGAGAVTVSGDPSVQMIGAGGSVITSLATTGVGSMILIEPIDLTVTPKKYLVIKGGA